ncbi:MAG: hypothetical protein ACP5XB_12505 [Isosphaeraceae bacterium]
MSHRTETSPFRDRTDFPGPRAREDVDLSAESVITIQPDGRVHLFGITREAVEVLTSIPCADPLMRQRLGRMLAAGKTVPEAAADSPLVTEAR